MNLRELENRLRNVEIENGEITSIEFTKDENQEPIFGIKPPILDEHCRIHIKLYPSSESKIGIELWLPIKNWNGKFLGTGNGGSAGSINKMSLYTGVSRGYATANTDMGSEVDADKLIGKPERLKDFGYRATHLMTVVSKQLIKAFYGNGAKYSYFLGCSTGGQQGLMEAQRYPEDYDGIISFAPANNRVRLHVSFVWNWLALAANPKAHFSKEQALAVQKKIIDIYAKDSGSAPGDYFLSYPGKVKIDADTLVSGENPVLLTTEQLNALKHYYEVSTDPVTEERIYVRGIAGCEDQVLTMNEIKDAFAKMFFFPFRWLWGKDFDFSKFDFHKDYNEAVEKLSPILDATDSDLNAFKNRGGKLLLLSGSVDVLIPYEDTKNYYEQVVKKMGGLENTFPFFRYFHIPGIGHGNGGIGFQEIGVLGGVPNLPLDKEHDLLSAMVAWVEKGEAPERLLPLAFSDGKIENGISHDRPVYQYPYETEYISGDPKNRDSFRKKSGNGIY